MRISVILAVSWLFLTPLGQALDLEDYQLIDLSYSFDENTLFWPTATERFDKETLSYGDTEGGWFYSAFSVCTPEHGGTHLDAPRHFALRGQTTEEIPLRHLVTPLVVIDVSEQAAEDRDYRLQPRDIARFEQSHGAIAPGSTVLLRTGWSRYWPEAKAYLGDDTPGDASKLSFPSFGLEATRLLLEERAVVGLGIDTASIDYGRSRDFPVHRLAANMNVVGLENLADLSALPATGAILMALPMKIGGGSGAPARVIALVPRAP